METPADSDDESDIFDQINPEDFEFLQKQCLQPYSHLEPLRDTQYGSNGEALAPATDTAFFDELFTSSEPASSCISHNFQHIPTADLFKQIVIPDDLLTKVPAHRSADKNCSGSSSTSDADSISQLDADNQKLNNNPGVIDCDSDPKKTLNPKKNLSEPTDKESIFVADTCEDTSLRNAEPESSKVEANPSESHSAKSTEPEAENEISTNKCAQSKIITAGWQKSPIKSSSHDSNTAPLSYGVGHLRGSQQRSVRHTSQASSTRGRIYAEAPVHPRAPATKAHLQKNEAKNIVNVKPKETATKEPRERRAKKGQEDIKVAELGKQAHLPQPDKTPVESVIIPGTSQSAEALGSCDAGYSSEPRNSSSLPKNFLLRSKSWGKQPSSNPLNLLAPSTRVSVSKNSPENVEYPDEDHDEGPEEAYPVGQHHQPGPKNVRFKNQPAPRVNAPKQPRPHDPQTKVQQHVTYYEDENYWYNGYYQPAEEDPKAYSRPRKERRKKPNQEFNPTIQQQQVLEMNSYVEKPADFRNTKKPAPVRKDSYYNSREPPEYSYPPYGRKSAQTQYPRRGRTSRWSYENTKDEATPDSYNTRQSATYSSKRGNHPYNYPLQTQNPNARQTERSTWKAGTNTNNSQGANSESWHNKSWSTESRSRIFSKSFRGRGSHSSQYAPARFRSEQPVFEDDEYSYETPVAISRQSEKYRKQSAYSETGAKSHSRGNSTPLYPQSLTRTSYQNVDDVPRQYHRSPKVFQTIDEVEYNNMAYCDETGFEANPSGWQSDTFQRTYEKQSPYAPNNAAFYSSGGEHEGERSDFSYHPSSAMMSTKVTEKKSHGELQPSSSSSSVPNSHSFPLNVLGDCIKQLKTLQISSPKNRINKAKDLDRKLTELLRLPRGGIFAADSLKQSGSRNSLSGLQ